MSFFNELTEYISLIVPISASLTSILYYLFSKRISKRIDNEYDDTISEIKKDISNISNKELIEITLKNSSPNIANNGKEYDLEKDIEIFIRAHHKQAIKQASIQFSLGIISSITGFIFILIVLLLQQNKVWYDYILNLLPGAIIEAVSILFLNQTNAVRERSSDFLNRLREDNQITKAIIIADSITDEVLKSEVKAKIAIHICGINESSFEKKNKE